MPQTNGKNCFPELPISALSTEDAQATASISMLKQLRLDETKPINHTGEHKECNMDIIQTHVVSGGSGGLSL